MFNKKKLGGFYYPKEYPTRFVTLVKLKFYLKAVWRWFRVQSIVPSFFGFQYRPSKDLIEIDITYECNMRCKNCNRSSAQAPDAVHIKHSDIEDFVNESILKNRHWRRVRILGGEPTLHPEFKLIIDTILVLKTHKLVDSIQLVTNGSGSKVKATLDDLPQGIEVENSQKKSNIQPSFGPFNDAPKDSLLYSNADFRHGCDIMHSCGIGLTPQGYYPCAVAGGIDRVTQAGSGRKNIPEIEDEMRDLLERNCHLCGRFRDGHYVPEKLRKPLLEQKTSASWKRIYNNWRTRKETNAKK